jgi:hypothetical protein
MSRALDAANGQGPVPRWNRVTAETEQGGPGRDRPDRLCCVLCSELCVREGGVEPSRGVGRSLRKVAFGRPGGLTMRYVALSWVRKMHSCPRRGHFPEE